METPRDYEISSDPARLDMELIHGFLSASYWAEGRSREAVERSIRNSLCFGVYDGARQVAFARLIADRAVFGYLADLFVIPDCRGRGIAVELVRAVVESAEQQGLKTFLLRTRDAHGLYSRFGFEALPHPEEMMARQADREQSLSAGRIRR